MVAGVSVVIGRSAEDCVCGVYREACHDFLIIPGHRLRIIGIVICRMIEWAWMGPEVGCQILKPIVAPDKAA